MHLWRHFQRHTMIVHGILLVGELYPMTSLSSKGIRHVRGTEKNLEALCGATTHQHALEGVAYTR
jgi:hypothetical protein